MLSKQSALLSFARPSAYLFLSKLDGRHFLLSLAGNRTLQLANTGTECIHNNPGLEIRRL